MIAALHRGEQMRKEGKTIPGIIKVLIYNFDQK